MTSFRRRFFKLIATLAGTNLPPEDSPLPPPNHPYPNESVERYTHYGSFSLKDGDLIVKDLESVGMPFEVELDDGIHEVHERFGSGGDRASMSIYVQKENFDLVTELVNVRFRNQ